MEDRVVSVDHEYFIFSVDQHHVPAGGEDEALCGCNDKVARCVKDTLDVGSMKDGRMCFHE